MASSSAGILLYRRRAGRLEVLLVHPGGPYWASKDEGAWSIPKGEYSPGEDPLEAARREFEEETGFPCRGDSAPLGTVRQPAGKVVHAWAVQGDVDANAIRSNTFEIEWPPRSGRRQRFPEIDRAGWFTLEQAETKILKGQRELLQRLASMTNAD